METEALRVLQEAGQLVGVTIEAQPGDNGCQIELPKDGTVARLIPGESEAFQFVVTRLLPLGLKAVEIADRRKR
tara:strand:- start:556 stop:777 length:222 start_codon:yes stop_codon:yes gene_type:complete